MEDKKPQPAIYGQNAVYASGAHPQQQQQQQQQQPSYPPNLYGQQQHPQQVQPNVNPYQNPPPPQPLYSNQQQPQQQTGGGPAPYYGQQQLPPGQQVPPPPPGQQEPMVIGEPIIQPASQTPPVVPKTPWKTGLCDCTSHPASCIEVMFCPWCQIGYQYRRVLSDKKPDGPEMDGYVCCGTLCLDTIFCCLASWCNTIEWRIGMMDKLRVEGDEEWKEGVNACCCPCCSLCQTHREATLRGLFPGGVCIKEPFRGPAGPRTIQ